MKYRQSDNKHQDFVEQQDYYGYWKIVKVFYTKELALDYIATTVV